MGWLGIIVVLVFVIGGAIYHTINHSLVIYPVPDLARPNRVNWYVRKL